MARDAGEMRRSEEHRTPAAVAAGPRLVDERSNQFGVVFQRTGGCRLLAERIGLGLWGRIRRLGARSHNRFALCCA
jgi:hypothetical protein